MSIVELRRHQYALVADIIGSGAIRQRLMDMGLMPNTRIQIKRFAPAGDPIWIKLNGYQLSLRRHEAAIVIVTRCE